MKKERSIHWLREFKDWMDTTSKKSVETRKEGSASLHHKTYVCTLGYAKFQNSNFCFLLY